MLHELTLHIGFEAAKGLSTRPVTINTPMEVAEVEHISDKVSIIPILRAGLGMSDAMLELLPNAAVHHIGMYRLKGSQTPVQYYNRLPKDNPSDVSFVLDPLIASGTTICATVNQIKKWGCKKVIVCAVLSTKAGLANIQKEHPDIEVVVGAVGDELGDDGIMRPGLGDAGDRQFGYGVGAAEHEAAAEAGKKRLSNGTASSSSSNKSARSAK